MMRQKKESESKKNKKRRVSAGPMLSMSHSPNSNDSPQSFSYQTQSSGCHAGLYTDQARSPGCHAGLYTDQARSPGCQAQSLGTVYQCGGSHSSLCENQKSFPITQHRSETPQEPFSKYVEALDHLSTKLRIPSSAVEPTNALHDDGRVPGVCRLFLQGRCRQGPHCHQVHARRDVVEALRRKALEAPSCCHLHGGQCNYEGLPFNLTVTIDNKTLGLHSLSPTNCLWTLYGGHGGNNLTVLKSQICREHRRGLCRFGEECGFLHICREIVIDGVEYFGAAPASCTRAQGNGNCLEACSLGTIINGNDNKGNGTADGMCASSLNACSFNGTGISGLMNGEMAPFGNCLYQMGSFLGAESESLNSTSRSRQSFSCRMSHTGNGESNKEFKGPLLRPLRPPQRGVVSQQRHNPYADLSASYSFHTTEN